MGRLKNALLNMVGIDAEKEAKHKSDLHKAVEASVLISQEAIKNAQETTVFAEKVKSRCKSRREEKAKALITEPEVQHG